MISGSELKPGLPLRGTPLTMGMAVATVNSRKTAAVRRGAALTCSKTFRPVVASPAMARRKPSMANLQSIHNFDFSCTGLGSNNQSHSYI